jgi:hypothetical protein
MVEVNEGEGERYEWRGKGRRKGVTWKGMMGESRLRVLVPLLNLVHVLACKV